MTDTKKPKKPQNSEEKVPVVKGAVMIKKPSTLQRIYGIFFQAKPEDVAKNVAKSVILPNVKYTLNDIWKRTGDMMFWGVDGKAPSRRGGRNYTDYSSRSRDRDRAFQNERSEQGSTRADSFKDIRYETRDDAEDVVAALQEDLMDYPETPVARVLEESGIQPDPIHFNWGWSNLDDADVEMEPDGWWKIIWPKIRRL